MKYLQPELRKILLMIENNNYILLNVFTFVKHHIMVN